MKLHLHIKFRIFNIDLGSLDQSITNDEINAALGKIGFGAIVPLAQIAEAQEKAATLYNDHGVLLEVVAA